MKAAFLALVLCAVPPTVGMKAAPEKNLFLPKDRDCFFIEDDLAYRRYLRLALNGTYRQFDQDGTATLETDRGAWTQDAQAIVSLCSAAGGLRFRALRSGPLTVTLGGTAETEALPALEAAIRRLLADSEAGIFTPDTAGGLFAPPLAVTVDRAAESFGRDDLTSLLAQIEQTTETERTHTYRLTPLRLPGGPLLLVLQGAIFGMDRAAATVREYHVPRGKAPPFYFAQTDSKTFDRQLGPFRPLESRWPAMTTVPEEAAHP